MSGAIPAGPPPLPPPEGSVIEIERTVSASGNLSLGNHVLSVGSPLAGQRGHREPGRPGRPHPVWRHPGPHPRLPGAQAGEYPAARSPRRPLCRPAPLSRPPEQFTVKRRVSVRGAIMIGGQRIQVGLLHAGKTVEVTVEADIYQITVADGITIAAPRKASRAINWHKASDYSLTGDDRGGCV